MSARPELLDSLRDARPVTRAEIVAALEFAGNDSEQDLKRRLRRLRQEVLLRVMQRDLAGLADLSEVCTAMSDLADECVACALSWAEAGLRARYGAACSDRGIPQNLLVVAMGKLGGRELNVSSDIDLVLLYSSEGETGGPERISNHEYFALLGKRLISLLSEPTGDGFVFRVDTRLRPYGESGPLVASLDALENYFHEQGREWERYAWLKARPLGDAESDTLLKLVQPFVYRKYLDYATLSAMRKLHAEVQRDVARRDLARNVKLGPGGIREIEFIVQALQLIRGGRDPWLAVRPTLEAIPRLTARGLLSDGAANELREAYDFLRMLEHRLQYLDDAQTHQIPDSPQDRGLLAEMCGLDSWDALSERLERVRASVTHQFQTLFGATPDPLPHDVWQDDSVAVENLLAQRGFAAAAESARRLGAVRSSHRYRVLPGESRLRFDALIPALAVAAAGTPDPDTTLARGLALVEAIARRAAYLALLAEHPEALERVTRIIAASSWAAEFITLHPLLLDELLDDRALYAHADWFAFAGVLRAQLIAQAPDVERQMNVLREQHQAQVFRLLAQDLAGALSVEKLGDHLSALADTTLGVTLDSLWNQTRDRHREDAPPFAVIAYGKLGGKELGYASDLDLIFIYDDAHERAPEVYARLAQRFNHWLTARTAAGALFETDLRLRPSGASGLLVSPVDAFERYQEESAWLWEHQALTRARFCAGDALLGERFEKIRQHILRRARAPADVAREVLAMRQRLHAAHPNRGALFDLKHDTGGMIDIEFAVQCLILTHAHAHPELAGNLGNIALLGIAQRLGLISLELCSGAQAAYREFRRLQHRLRLDGAQFARVPANAIATHRAAVNRLSSAVFELSFDVRSAENPGRGK